MMSREKTWTNYNKPQKEEVKEAVQEIGIDLAEGSDFTSGIEPVEEKSEVIFYYKIKDCTALNVRRTPSIAKDNVIATLNPTSIFEVRNIETKGWKHIATKDGIQGYVMADYIKEI